MNNKGFAITTILYGTLIVFLMLFVSMLGILASYKDRLALLIDNNNGARDIINGNSCNTTPSNSCITSTDGITPTLDPGMIPVVIANNGTVTTVSKCGDGWHSYTEEKKQWANVVLVTDSSRSKYLNTEKVPVDTDDILAYFVWIPKYSYKMNEKEKPISISFNYDKEGYNPHPAFKFGSDKIDGLWVGKFETTGDSASGYTVLPGKTPNYDLNLYSKSVAANSFAGNNNSYGLVSSDSHISLNSDWGAVAYLSHSDYGIGKEVRINNKSFYKGDGGSSTGCGANEDNSRVNYAKCEIKYGGVDSGEYPQSTTGNISGVFDMSGGVLEIVMGNNQGNAGESGWKTTVYPSYPSMPDSKYFNIYDPPCNFDMCGGHALYETEGWYSDTMTFVSSSRNWFVRGGKHVDKDSAGLFYYASVNGTSDETGWRTSIVVGS